MKKIFVNKLFDKAKYNVKHACLRCATAVALAAAVIKMFVKIA